MTFYVNFLLEMSTLFFLNKKKNEEKKKKIEMFSAVVVNSALRVNQKPYSSTR